MAGDHAARVTKAIDRPADVPDKSELVLMEFDFVVVAAVVQVHPRSIFLFLPWESPQAVRRIVLLHEKIDVTGRVDGLNRDLMHPGIGADGGGHGDLGHFGPQTFCDAVDRGAHIDRFGHQL